MPAALRYLVRTARDLAMYVVRTGRWWMPVLVILLAVTAIVVATAKVVVPTAIYTMF